VQFQKGRKEEEGEEGGKEKEGLLLEREDAFTN